MKKIKIKKIWLNKSVKIKLFIIVSVVMILSGISFLVYPYIINAFSENEQLRILEEWEGSGNQKDTQELDNVKIFNNQNGDTDVKTSETIAEINSNETNEIKEKEKYQTVPEVDYSGLSSDDFFPLKILIPKIEVEWIVNEGTDTQTLKKGPGHIIETVLPGDDGRCVISGHRTTYGAPFNRIDELEPGDIIYLETFKGEIFTYAVRELIVVNPTDVYILEGDSKRELLLTACEPKYSAAKRLVIFSELVMLYDF